MASHQLLGVTNEFTVGIKKENEMPPTSRETLIHRTVNESLVSELLAAEVAEINRSNDDYPIPPKLDQCYWCDSNVYSLDIDWSLYEQFRIFNIVRRGEEEGDSYSPIEIQHMGVTRTAHFCCTYKCPLCNERNCRNEMRSLNRINVCKTCFELAEECNTLEICFSCDTWVPEDEINYSEYLDNSLCEFCLFNRCFDCRECSYVATAGDLEEHNCEDHYNNENYLGRWVRSYGYKPDPIFYGIAPYYLGVELEIEAKDSERYADGAEYLYNTIGDQAYLKFDGSLDTGIEIVTHPLSLEWHQKNFPWKQILEKVQRMKFRSWNTQNCGLHIHVCKPNAYKDEQHRIRFMKLVYDNESQMSLLAGRTSSDYASFHDKGKIIPKVKWGDQSTGRYSAINVENGNTDEIRIFRGSLRPERVLSAIELVHASIEYTRNMKIVPKNKPLSWIRFAAYVSEHDETYPNLFLIMNEVFERKENMDNQQDMGGND